METTVTAPRSLHVVTSTARRGAETFAVELVDALRQRGEPADVMALSPSPLPRSYEIPVLGSSPLAPRTLRELRRVAASYDVVVAHGSTTLPACAVALARARTPFVYRNIGDPDWWIRSGARAIWVRLAMRRASRVVALWEGAAERLIANHHLNPGSVDVIPNGVATGRHPSRTEASRAAAIQALGLACAGPNLAFIGALSSEKAPELAVAVAHLLPGSTLLIAGDGPERQPLEGLARRGPATVRFLGQVVGVTHLLAAADVLLITSRTEGMPAVLIEAMLVGTPVVASAVGAIPEMLSAGGGVTISDRNPVHFARAIESILEEGREPVPWSAVERYEMASVTSSWSRTLRAASP